MSKTQHRRCGLIGSNGKPAYNSVIAENLALKHIMDKPAIPVYPLNDGEDMETSPNAQKSTTNLIYPDFCPWKDCSSKSEEEQREEADLLDNSSYLNKGYFEAPVVANEYYSARNLIQATLFSSTDNCNSVLKELSLHLGKAYSIRNELINKISHNSNKLRAPPRVTLTSAKREMWLRDLANPSVPLSKVAEKVPHGLRNKALIDAMCSKRVPIQRALWFTKCVLLGELVALRKKSLSRGTTTRVISSTQSEYFESDKQEIHWLLEWTQQVSDYILRFFREVPSTRTSSKKHENEDKMNYLVRYVLALYVECLVDKTHLMLMMIMMMKLALPLSPSSLSKMTDSQDLEADNDDHVSNIRSHDINYSQALAGMTFVQVFWKDILKLDHLSKELVELLLLLNLYVKNASGATEDSQSPTDNIVALKMIMDAILETTRTQLTFLFNQNENFFIIPTYWNHIKSVLFEIVLESHETSDEAALLAARQKLDLISFRIESLILNKKEGMTDMNGGFVNKPYEGGMSQRGLEHSVTIPRRPYDDMLQILLSLDQLKLNEEFAALLRPPESPNQRGHPNWKSHLRLVLGWCVSLDRDPGPSSESVLTVCHFIKSHLLSSLGRRGSTSIKIQIENEILDVIFNLCDRNDPANLELKLYVLMNELYQLKALTISSYIRKLIASGILYSTDNPSLEESFLVSQKLEIHLNVLRNMPIINNKQCDSIMRKFSTTACDIRSTLEDGKSLLLEVLIKPLLINETYLNASAMLDNLNKFGVGVKFLLMNWLTTTLKAEISNSPKLIRVTPAFISMIYDLYSMCDSLSVFFKVVVKFILRNKGGVLIYYLDSLYLLARLVMRHYKLVQSMRESMSEPPLVACGLFELIISNYMDLRNREYDYFNFHVVWKFISHTTHKRVFRVESDGAQLQNCMYPNGVYTPLGDSPFQLRTPGTDECSPGHGEKDMGEALIFLKELTTSSPSLLTPDELVETLELVPSISTEFSSSETPEEILHLLFAEIMACASDSDATVALIRLCTHVLRSLNDEGPCQILTVLSTHVKGQVDAGMSLSGNLQYLITTLVVYEIISIESCQEMLSSLQFQGDHSLDAMLYGLILGSRECELPIARWQHILLDSNLHQRWKARPESCAKLCKILRDLSPLSTSSIFAYHRPYVQLFFNQMLLSDNKMTVEALEILTVEDSILLLNGCGFATNASGVGDILGHPHLVNEFTLAKYQPLLGLLTASEDLGLHEASMKNQMQVLVETFVDSMNFHFDSENLYFGELFHFMRRDYQICVLTTLETRFFEHTCFHTVEESNVPLMVSLSSVTTNENLLPVFDDYFRKFPTNFEGSVTTDLAFFGNSLRFLARLVSTTQGGHSDDDGLRWAVSSFLQILIIHKASLPAMIVEHDNQQFEFIKMLVSLLSSPYFQNGNERAKILLYDFVAILKGSISDHLALANNRDGITPSPLLNDSTFTGGFLETMVDQDKPQASALDSLLTLNDEELDYGGDFHSINSSGLVLRRKASCENAITRRSLIVSDSHSESPQEYPYALKSFEILEDTGSAINNSCINLQLFDSYITRENPL